METHQTALEGNLNDVIDLTAARPATARLDLMDTRKLRVGEAAKAIGVHKRTLYGWIEKGLVETQFLPSGVTVVVMASVYATVRPTTAVRRTTQQSPKTHKTPEAA